MTAAGAPEAVRLERAYDPDELVTDLRRLDRESWRRQRTYSATGTTEDHPADWRVLPLRSPGGDPARTDAGGPGPEPFADTVWLRAAPALRELLAALPATVRSARLMSLAPGASVATHRDTPLGFGHGFLRLHVPITTNPAATLVLDGVVHRWQPGTLWFGDFARPHSIANAGARARVHLVVDCAVRPDTLDLFPAGYRELLDDAEILFERPEVPLSAAAARGFACRFPMPADFGDWSGEPLDPVRPGAGAGDRPAEVTVHGATPVCTAGSDGPTFALCHVGGAEFRLQGWTDERSIHLDRHRGVARFLVRRGSTVHVTERPLDPSRPATRA